MSRLPEATRGLSIHNNWYILVAGLQHVKSESPKLPGELNVGIRVFSVELPSP